MDQSWRKQNHSVPSLDPVSRLRLSMVVSQPKKKNQVAPSGLEVTTFTVLMKLVVKVGDLPISAVTESDHHHAWMLPP